MTCPAIVATAVLALVLSPPVGASSRPVDCQLSRLRIVDAGMVSEATGQNTLAFRVVNRGTTACALRGYPRVTLLDASGPEPFRVSHRGDQMITARPPVTVRLSSGRSAYFAINKYRCDLGNLRITRRLRIGLGAGSGTTTVRVPRYPIMAYCGRHDPGSLLTVSPFEPTPAAPFAHGG